MVTGKSGSDVVVGTETSQGQDKNQKRNYTPCKSNASPKSRSRGSVPHIETRDNPNYDNHRDDISHKCPEVTNKTVVLIAADPVKLVEKMVPPKRFVLNKKTFLVNKICESYG